MARKPKSQEELLHMLRLRNRRIEKLKQDLHNAHWEMNECVYALQRIREVTNKQVDLRIACLRTELKKDA